MSYARFSEGDIYLYKNVGGGWTCCACTEAGHTVNFATIGAVANHVRQHADAGDDIPPRASRRIAEELTEHGVNWTGED